MTRLSTVIVISTALVGCSGAGAYPDYDGRDLDCSDVGHEVQVPSGDPHGLDGDRDGIGCEGW